MVRAATSEIISGRVARQERESSQVNSKRLARMAAGVCLVGASATVLAGCRTNNGKVINGSVTVGKAVGTGAKGAAESNVKLLELTPCFTGDLLTLIRKGLHLANDGDTYKPCGGAEGDKPKVPEGVIDRLVDYGNGMGYNTVHVLRDYGVKHELVVVAYAQGDTLPHQPANECQVQLIPKVVADKGKERVAGPNGKMIEAEVYDVGVEVVAVDGRLGVNFRPWSGNKSQYELDGGVDDFGMNVREDVVRKVMDTQGTLSQHPYACQPVGP